MSFVCSVQVKTSLNHADFLRYEKEKCLRLLGIDDVRSNVQLDQLVSDVTGMCLNADMTVESKDDIIARLKNRVAELDQQLVEHQSQVCAKLNNGVTDLDQQLVARQSQVFARLRNRMTEIDQQLVEHQSQVCARSIRCVPDSRTEWQTSINNW